MRILKRPDSTTVLAEIAFHLIKSKKEADNIFKDVDVKNIHILLKIVDDKTFEQMIYCMIYRINIHSYNWSIPYYYCFPIQYVDLNVY